MKYIPWTFNKNADNFFLDCRKLFSYGCQINILIGARRIGKTFAVKKILIDKFIYKKQLFAFLRDNNEARIKLASNFGKKFFSDVNKYAYKNKLNGKIFGENIYIDNETCGYLMPCSTFQNYKGNDFEEIINIAYDEFMGEKNKKYNPNEAYEFINMLYSIISIRRNVRIYLMANALDIGNPILNLFGIKIDKFGIYINRDKNVALLYADNHPDFNKARDNSIAGKLIKGTEFEENLFNNKFVNHDKDLYYYKKPPKCHLLFGLCFNDEYIRVYTDYKKYYICRDFNDKSSKQIYVNDIKFVNTKRKLIYKEILEKLKEEFNNKNILFENTHSKQMFVNFIARK